MAHWYEILDLVKTVLRAIVKALDAVSNSRNYRADEPQYKHNPEDNR